MSTPSSSPSISSSNSSSGPADPIKKSSTFDENSKILGIVVGSIFGFAILCCIYFMVRKPSQPNSSPELPPPSGGFYMYYPYL